MCAALTQPSISNVVSRGSEKNLCSWRVIALLDIASSRQLAIMSALKFVLPYPSWFKHELGGNWIRVVLRQGSAAAAAASSEAHGPYSCTAATSKHRTVLEDPRSCLTEQCPPVQPLLSLRSHFVPAPLGGHVLHPSPPTPTSPFPMLRLGSEVSTHGPTSVLSGLILRTVLLIWHLPALSEATANTVFSSLAWGVGHLWQSIRLETKVVQKETWTGTK